MSNPPYNLFGQSSPIQDEEVLPKEPPQKDLWRGLPTFQSGPCLYSSGTTSLKSVGLAPSVTHGSKNKTDGLAETRTTSNLNCTSVGFYSSSSEFFSASDGQRLSDMDFDERLFDLSSSHRKDVHANTSKFIKDLEVGDTNITDQPDLSNLAITRQAAAKILMDYGLEKEDLDELISCPTEQTTAQNLPRTLWKIRMKKALRAATTNKSTLGSEPLSSTRDSGLNPVNAPEGVGTGQAVVPPTTGQHSKVVDFQHLEIHTAAVDKTLDTTDSANKSNQSPQEGIMALKRSILNLFSSQQTVCITSVNLTGNSETPPGSSSVKLLQNDPNRSLLKSEVSKSSVLGKVVPTVEAVPACGFLTGIIPKPDLVSVKGNDISSGQMDIQGEAPKFTEKTMDQTPPVQQLFKSHMGQTEGSKVVPAGKPMPLLSLTIPARNNAPLPLLTLDLLPQQVLDPAKTKKKPSQEGKPTAKGLPSLTVMHDYAGFTPRKFSHTCSLCKKTCSQMKEWKSHKYTSLHLQNCKDLRKRYPKWDGKVPQLQRKSLVPVQASMPHPQKRRAKSRSRSSSQSPVRYRVSEDGRESGCGRTRSQRSPRRISRSRSSSWSPQYDWTSTSHNRSRSRSLERGRSPKRRDRRRSSPRRSIERQFSPRRFSPRRFMERQFSPGRIIERRFSPGRIVEPQFSPGRIIERRFSPGRIMERRFSPKRVIERRFSPRRSREQRSSSRSRERQSSPRRIIERRFSPRRSRERRSSPRIFIERRFSSSRSRERRSSSSSSRERRSSPRRSIEQRSSPRRIIERRYSSSSSRERRSSPRRSIEQRSSPRKIIERRYSSSSSRERRSSPRRSIERRSSPRRSIERRSSPRRSIERRSSPRRSIERRSSPRRIIERRYSSSSSIDRWSSPRRSIERRSSPRTKGDKRLSPRLSHEQSLSPKRIEERSLVKSIPKFRSSPLKKNEKRSSLTKSCKRKASHLKSLPPQKKPCSLENLTERLLKTPVVQSLSGQQSVEDMVKTMVPFVLEELARMSTSSSSPAPLSKLLKDSSSSSPLSGESSFLSAGSTSSSAVKVGRIANLNNENTSPIKSKFSKPSPPTMVKLKGTFDTLCHRDLISAMDIYGKTKSVLLFKPKQEARVCFEKEEAALKLKASKNFEIKGVSVTVVPEKDVVFERPTQTSTPEQKNPQQNSSDLSPTTSQTSSTGSTTVLSFKKLLSLPEKPQTSTTGKRLTEAKSSAFKGKIGAAKKTVKSIKPKSITAKAAIESAVVEKELSMRQETEECQKSPEETPQTEKPADFIVAKPSKEFLAFNAEMAPTATHEKLEEPAKSVGKLLIKAPENKWLHPAHGDEKDGGNAKKLLESIVSERQLVPSEVQVEAMDTKDQESILEAGDSAEAMPPTEIKDHSELPEVFVEAKDVADSGHEEKAQESEILKDKSSENKTDPKTLPAKPNKSLPPTSTLEIKLETPSTYQLKKPEDNQQKPPETSVKAASTTPVSGSSGNLSVGASAETSSDAKTSVGVETKTCHTVPTSVSASANAKKTPKPPPESKHPLPLSCQQATNISTYISPQTLNRVKPSQNLFSDDLSFSSLLMLISNLPIQTFTSYTEEDVVHVLSKFGFKYEDDNIYIFPGKCMALVLMPDIWTVNDILKVSNSNYFTLKTRKLVASVLTKNISMSPLGFYKCMLKLTPLPVKDDENVVYIQDISCSEIKDLLTVMKKTDSVTSYLPLMNKVFIEFETMYDADRIGVWYSLLKRRRSHKVRRLKTPRFTSTSQPPKLPMQALPNSKDIIDGSIIVPESVTVPAGSTPPFWVTMTTSPYVFATVSPWFSIPDFLTVQNLDDLNKASSQASAFSTVMLTGLPEGNYTQQDVAKLLEPHFSKKPLNHNLMILPLQRRAFVCFYSWDVCCSFIQDHIKNPVSVHGCKLQLHLVLEDLQLGSSQDLMYKSLMKLSHIYVPELDHVGDQLLCVEVSEVKLDLIKDVVKEVASAASFVNFLPLANKIWVEMVSASDAEKVVKKLLSVKDVSKDSLWSIVGRIETLKSLKQRLKDAIEDPVDLPAASKPTDSGGPESAEEKASTLSSDHTPHGAPQKEQSGNKQSVNTPGPVQSDSPPEPQTPIEGLKTAGGDLKEEQEAAGVPADDLEAKQTPAGGGATPEKDPAAAATRNQPDPTSGGISIKPSPEVKRPPFLNPFTVTDVPSPTVGEKIGTLLHLEQISYLSEDSIKTPEKVTIQRRVILITNLPEFHDDCYSEADISNLLRNFGFQYEDTHLYVIPQSCMAFALMPSFRSVKKLMKESESKPFTLLGSRLHLHVVTSNILMSPFGFYKSLMALVKVKVIDDGASTIYINNISPSESRFLRAALQKIDSVKNYLPLLNKVFVEFESIRDADRLGVWYSLLKNCPAFSIFRLRIPRNDKTSLPPRLATKALPDCKDVVPGAVVPATNCGVPLGSTAPFSVTMTTAPYVFPTMSPWFKIPDFVTVFEIKDIQKVKFRAWKFSTIMLTNLPEGNYSHREVVKLVWDYFPNQNLQTINYKVVVLPLQRRAFVLFENWSSCCKFVQSHGTAPVRVQGSKLNLHMVLEELQIGSCEETLFRSLMKWSNSRVPELESLEDRLLCVHISKVSVQLIILIMKTVGAIAPFVSFLPLANRICIEMVEASGVTQVVKKLSDKSEVGEWSKVQSVESLQSLKQRLKKQENLKITLDDTSKSATALKQKVPKLAVQTKPSETAANVNPGVKNSESGELGGGQTEPMEVEASASNSKDVLPEEACSAPPPERLTAPPPRATADVKTQETEDLKEPQSTMKASQRKQEPEPQTGVEVKEEEDEIKQPDPNPGAAASTSSHVTRLTPGEQTVHELTPVMLGCCKPKNILRMIGRAHPDPIREHKGYRGHYVKVYGPNVLCLANLPMYEDCSYSEVDIVNMLRGFGVECGTDDVFVFIESRLALVYLESVEKVENFFWVLKTKHLILKGHRLHACALRKMVKNSVLGIYIYIMSRTHFGSSFSKWCMVYIQNIPHSDRSNLIQTVKKVCSVKNVLPMLNKVLIECTSLIDVDLLGVWLASQKKHQPYSVVRMDEGSPRLSPGSVMKAVPGSTGDFTVIHTTEVIPVDSLPPFWINMVIEPYVFNTHSPWFKIPDFWTLNQKIHAKTYSKASQFSTVMLTGALCFDQKEILQRVLSFFAEQNLFTLSYRVVVLPLQSRAFIFFSSWKECLKFVNDEFKRPSQARKYSVHLVLEDMNPGYCEEDQYRSLMKWSNAHVTETASLEERLLCVGVTATNVDLTKAVLMGVARVAPFVNVLPLGNMIYIEMVDSNAAEKVLKNTPTFSDTDMERILLIESVKGRKERLKGCERIPVNIDDPFQLTAQLPRQPPALVKVHQDSSSSVSVVTPASAGDSELLASSSSLGESSNVETEEGSRVQTVKNVGDVPPMDEKSFNAIKAAVQFYKQTQKSKNNQTSNKTPEDSSKDSLSDESCSVDKVQDTTAAESSSQTVDASMVANEVTVKPLEDSTTSGSSCSSPSQLTEAHRNPSETVQTSHASAEQKSPLPTDHSSLSEEDLLKLDESADDKSSEMESQTQMKKNPEKEEKDEDEKDNDHKTLNSSDPQNNKEVQTCELKEQRSQEDDPQEPSSETQMEAERSSRRRSSRRIQEEKKTQEDKVMVREPSSISTRSSTRRMTEKTSNVGKGTMTPIKKTPASRKRPSSGAEDVKKEENPTPSRPRGRPRKRTRLAADEAEEPEQNPPPPRSPSPASDYELPPYNPKTPLGQQFVESKWGFFCKLCSLPFLTKEQHCSSKEHYDNLQGDKSPDDEIQLKDGKTIQDTMPCIPRSSVERKLKKKEKKDKMQRKSPSGQARIQSQATEALGRHTAVAILTDKPPETDLCVGDLLTLDPPAEDHEMTEEQPEDFRCVNKELPQDGKAASPIPTAMGRYFRPARAQIPRGRKVQFYSLIYLVSGRTDIIKLNKRFLRQPHVWSNIVMVKNGEPCGRCQHLTREEEEDLKSSSVILHRYSENPRVSADWCGASKNLVSITVWGHPEDQYLPRFQWMECRTREETPRRYFVFEDLEPSAPFYTQQGGC